MQEKISIDYYIEIEIQVGRGYFVQDGTPQKVQEALISTLTHFKKAA
ncbi:hypothetical protein ACFL20_12410 [Spirochaetota bacterium]